MGSRWAFTRSMWYENGKILPVFSLSGGVDSCSIQISHFKSNQDTFRCHGGAKHFPSQNPSPTRRRTRASRLVPFRRSTNRTESQTRSPSESYNTHTHASRLLPSPSSLPSPPSHPSPSAPRPDASEPQIPSPPRKT
jgi:hypothetical protein